MTTLEMEPSIKEVWDEFIEWVYTAHQRGGWYPNYYSILFWEEFKKEKKK